MAFLLQIKTTVMEVEFPLIKSELEAIDVKLQSAETTLFWNGEGAQAPSVPRDGCSACALVLWSSQFCLQASERCLDCCHHLLVQTIRPAHVTLTNEQRPMGTHQGSTHFLTGPWRPGTPCAYHMSVATQ